MTKADKMPDELYYTPEYFKNVLCQHYLVEGVDWTTECSFNGNEIMFRIDLYGMDPLFLNFSYQVKNGKIKLPFSKSYVDDLLLYFDRC